MRARHAVVEWIIACAGVGAVVAAFALGPRALTRAPEAPLEAPVVMGRREGCLACHAGITGLDASHRPENIGCASCHGGNVASLVADEAHAGMIRVPGNLADAPRTCGQAMCHSAVIPRVERSIMTTFAGVIEVDRRV